MESANRAVTVRERMPIHAIPLPWPGAVAKPVRELHIHTSELVREAAEGGVIVIERRGEPVAELRPLTAPRHMPASKKARIFTSMRKIWARMPQAGDSTKILEEDRSR